MADPDPIARAQQTLEARYPWLRGELVATRSYTFARQIEFETPVAVLWPLLSDTSRLNRALGIPAASFVENGAERLGRSRYWRWSFAWEEPPWEWNAGDLLVCRKAFTSAPVREVLAILQMSATDTGGSLLTLWYGWVPGGVFGRLVAPRLNGFIRRGWDRVEPELRTWEAAGSRPRDFPLRRGRRSTPSPDVVDRVTEAKRRLQDEGCSASSIDGLLDHIVQGDPLELDRIRPFALADTLPNVTRESMLRTALRGTAAGVLQARWDVVCPHCRGMRESLPNLGAVAPTSRCAACAVEFDATSDRLELTFRVHPAIRAIEPRVYCSADPAMKPHVQFQIQRAAEVVLPASIQPGAYRLRSSDFTTQVNIDVVDDGPHVLGPEFAGLERCGRGAEIRLPSGPEQWLFERRDAGADAVRAADVLSSAAYRAVMGDERLGPSIALEVGVQTLLFTDIVASTELYRTIGDRAAFDAVRNQFTVLFDLVQAEGGVVVKTIGDAVMAAFKDPASGWRAAQSIARADLGEVSVRVSMHTGRCLAVNLDTGLDYFGSVVNEAAKLQGAAGASEVALSPELASRLGVHGRSVEYASGDEVRVATVWSATDG